MFATDLIDDAGDADQLSLQGVVAKIGISAPSIYRHFLDVEHLQTAVVHGCFAEFGRVRDAASSETTDPARAVLARCGAYCQFALEHPGPYWIMFGRAPNRPVSTGRRRPLGERGTAGTSRAGPAHPPRWTGAVVILSVLPTAAGAFLAWWQSSLGGRARRPTPTGRETGSVSYRCR